MPGTSEARPTEVQPATSVQQTLLEYQAILANASIGILFTRDRKVLHCNPKFSEIFGWPHGELVGQPGAVFYLSDEEYAEIGRLATPMLTRGGHAGRGTAHASQGRQCDLLPPAGQGNQSAEHGGGHDLDHRGHQRTQARASPGCEDLLLKQQAILEYASLGIMFTSNGQIVHCNPRIDAILDWPVGSLEGQYGRGHLSRP